MGQILVKGFTEYRVFPLKLSKAFFVALIFGEEKVPSDTLVESYLLFLNKCDRRVMENALKGSLDDDDYDALIDILDREGSHSIPSMHFILSESGNMVKTLASSLCVENEFQNEECTSRDTPFLSCPSRSLRTLVVLSYPSGSAHSVCMSCKLFSYWFVVFS